MTKGRKLSVGNLPSEMNEVRPKAARGGDGFGNGQSQRRTVAKGIARGRPPERRGVPNSGRIETLFIGQGHGFIRLAGGREVFFHRSDVLEGTSFNALAVGDRVIFELLEDHVSGPRALCVEPRQPRR